MNKDASEIKLLLVDDHRLLRDGLAAILRESEDIEIVGSVSSGEEAIRLFPSLNPDVILMDIMMGGMTGIEATRWIKEQNNDVKVILISAEVKKELVTAGIEAGTDGYLPKDVEKEILIEAIRAVHNGGRYFNEAITNLVFEDLYQKKKMPPGNGNSPLPNTLTKREQQVMTLIAAGKSNTEVANELFISTKTVNTHKGHILEKLGLKNTAELVKYAIRNNIIPMS
jgi:DNA-binding NarL/FixJ family response regulator